jgi:hypothetical protein
MEPNIQPSGSSQTWKNLWVGRIGLGFGPRDYVRVGFSLVPDPDTHSQDDYKPDLQPGNPGPLLTLIEGEGAQWSSCQVKPACPKTEIECDSSWDRTQNSNTFDSNFPCYPQYIYHTLELSSANAFRFTRGTSNISYVCLARPSFCDRLSSSSKLPE